MIKRVAICDMCGKEPAAAVKVLTDKADPNVAYSTDTYEDFHLCARCAARMLTSCFDLFGGQLEVLRQQLIKGRILTQRLRAE